MSWFTDLTASIGKATELYHNINLKLNQVQKDTEEPARETSLTRTDCNKLSERVVRLEESRSAIATEVEAKVSVAIAQAVANLWVDYAQAKAEMTVKHAQS